MNSHGGRSGESSMMEEDLFSNGLYSSFHIILNLNVLCANSFLSRH